MTNEILMEQDALARQKIVEQIHRNFFVEAGAGSGKTTILVSRMVAMVEAGIDVSKICAITFTKAAAGEFYDRFQKRLIERSTAPTEASYDPEPGKLPNPTDVTRQRCLDALNNLDLCFMGTIDSFCHMVLAEHPVKAGIPSHAMLLNEGDMLPHYKRIFSQIQAGLHGEALHQLCQRFCLFHQRPADVFADSIGKIMGARNCHFDFDPMPEGDLQDVVDANLTPLSKVLETMLAHKLELKDTNKDSSEAWDLLEKNFHVFKQPWADNIPSMIWVLNKIKKIRIIPEANMSLFGSGGDNIFEPHYTKTKFTWYNLKEEWLNKLTTLQYAASMEFLTAAAETIAQILRNEGYLTFFDYLLYLRDVLREDAGQEGKMIRHIYDRHQYFLIDEFQDTNPMQAEVFFYLTAQEPQTNWRSCIPHPGSLFIVGDPKQSIYRFRHADVTAFMTIRKLFEGMGESGEAVDLTRNFRSTYKLRNWFNHTFQVLLPEQTEIQSKFNPIPLESAPAAEAEDTFPGGVYFYPISVDEDAPPEAKDPAMVAKVIRRIVGNPAYQIPDENGNLQPAQYKDIMVITYGKSKMDGYIQALAENKIPFRAEGKVLFSQCPSLVAASRILGAVADPYSLQKLIGALTCGRFGFNYNTLLRLKNENKSLGIFQPLPEDEPIAATIAQLQDLTWRARQLSATALFSLLLEELQIFRYVGTKDMECVYFALELLRSAESSGQVSSLIQASDYLEQLISDESEVERAISLTQAENRVHMANLHKVKGLEAPIVILADPKYGGSSAEIRVEQQDPTPVCHILKVTKKLGVRHISQFSCVGKEAIQEAEKKCLTAEKERLLYVAATRAKRMLVIADVKKEDGSTKAGYSWGPFIKHCEGDFFTMTEDGTIAPPKTPDKADFDTLYNEANNLLLTTTSGEKSYAILRPSQIKLKGKTSDEDDFEDTAAEKPEEVRSRTVRSDGAIIGTLVHSMMEVMVSSRNTTALPELVEEILSEYDTQTEEYRQMLTQVGTTMQNGGYPQIFGAEQDILKVLLDADEVYCEVPFCRKTGSEIWHGIMDVVYRIGEDWFILDYKTNADDHDLDVKYQEQLAAYVEAFHDLTGHKAMALIYHVDA